MSVLSAQDRIFWQENGYVVIPQAVPPENLRAVVDAIHDFQEMDPDDPETWYPRPQPNQMEELNYSGMVEMFHHQSLWNNRQHPRVYQAFREIFEQDQLWVTIDRVNFNPPARPDWDFRGFIHWDVDTSLRPIPFSVQGILCLTDTDAAQGGFQCVPEIFRNLEEWIESQPKGRDPWRPALRGEEVRRLETRAGDLLIWHCALPHGTSVNRTDRPRMAQYISMFPAQEENEEMRRQRIECWRRRSSPEGIAFPGDPRRREEQANRPARLTELGEKLLGLRDWEGGWRGEHARGIPFVRETPR